MSLIKPGEVVSEAIQRKDLSRLARKGCSFPEIELKAG